MKILFKVEKSETNAWTCDDFMISKRVASVLPANVLVVKGKTAVLYGEPELKEVFNTTTGVSAGFRLTGVAGKLMETLVTIDAQQAARKAEHALLSVEDAIGA